MVGQCIWKTTNSINSCCWQFNIQSELKVDKELASASHMVELMNSFKDAKAAMQCPLKAAFHHPTFVQFFDKKERKAL